MKAKFLILTLFHSYAFASSQMYSDWYPTTNCKYLCHGYYVEPEYPYTFDKKETPLIIEADSINLDINNKSILDGNVVLTFGNQVVKTDTATILKKDNRVNQVTAKGYTIITEPGIRLDGNNVNVNQELNVKTMYDANYRLYSNHARGVAENITMFGDHKIKLQSASYTTCAPYNNTWALRAKSIDINLQKGRGYAKHAYLEVKDVPIFYLPYINFSVNNKRKTGFLTPHFGSTNHSGQEMVLPFYLNLAPNYDLTISPKISTKRSFEFKNHFRYLTHNSNGYLIANIIPFDKAYDDFKKNKKQNLSYPVSDPRAKGLDSSSTRHFIKLFHYTRFNTNWDGLIQYSRVSDDNYFANLGDSIGTVSQSHLLQEANINYRDENWLGQGKLLNYQILFPYENEIGDEPYQKLPEILFRSQHLDLPFNFRAKSTSSLVYFHTSHNALTGKIKDNGFRYHIKPELSYPIVSSAYQITPRLQLDGLFYDISTGDEAKILNYPDSPSRVIPIIDIDSTVFFEKIFSIAHSDFIQTLEPRLYALYIPFRDQSRLPSFDTGVLAQDVNTAYFYNKFSGIDRLSDTKQVTFGLTSRLFSLYNGEQILSLSLNQIYNFNRRKVTNCNPLTDSLCLLKEDNNNRFSNLMTTIHYSYNNSFYGFFNFEWSHKKKHIEKESIQIQFNPNEWNVLNLGYQYIDSNPADVNSDGTFNPLKQADGSIALQINDNFRVINSVHYNLQKKHLNNFWLGLEHQGCCTAMRTGVHIFRNYGAKSDRRYHQKVFFQFVFKGLDSVGHSYQNLNQELPKVIPGYNWKDNIVHH